MQARRLPERKLPRAHEAENRAVGVPPHPSSDEEPGKDEDQAEPVAVQHPSDAAQQGANHEKKRPDLEQVPGDEEPARTRLLARPRSAHEAANRAPERRTGSSNGATRCSATERGCARST